MVVEADYIFSSSDELACSLDAAAERPEDCDFTHREASLFRTLHFVIEHTISHFLITANYDTFLLKISLTVLFTKPTSDSFFNSYDFESPFYVNSRHSLRVFIFPPKITVSSICLEGKNDHATPRVGSAISRHKKYVGCEDKKAGSCCFNTINADTSTATTSNHEW